MKFSLVNLELKEIIADLEMILVIDKVFSHRFIEDEALLKRASFQGNQDEVCHLVSTNRVYVGVETFDAEHIRSAIAVATRSFIAKSAYKSVKIATYMHTPHTFNTLQAMVEGFVLGGYQFQRYQTKKSSVAFKKVMISSESFNQEAFSLERAIEVIHHAEVVAMATNFTRDIVNTTPEDCYPKRLAQLAQTLEKKDVVCNILKPKELKKEGMNMLLAVSRASRHKPRVIHLSYKPKNPQYCISLVGKGLTYDSGGLSLKPADYMATMKSDKSGGATVLGIMKAVSELKLPIEVHGFIGAVENMIGGDAYKPDDVLMAKNGKTVEVKNTDAEGRLVLGDLLVYAQQEVSSDYLFDFATLTGACVVGVGQYTSGVMGYNHRLKERVVSLAYQSGEFATRLDFNRYLAKTLTSNIADLSNISNTRYGGAITAGQFLAEFITEENREKWVHIDIAGPAFVEHIWGENPSGASGAGVRMMMEFLTSLTQKSL